MIRLVFGFFGMIIAVSTVDWTIRNMLTIPKDNTPDLTLTGPPGSRAIAAASGT